MNGALVHLATAFALVAVAAIAVGIVAWLLAGRRLPEAKPFASSFTAIEVIVFVVLFLVVDGIGLGLVLQPAAVKWLLPPPLADDAALVPAQSAFAAGLGPLPATASRDRFDAVLPAAGLWGRIAAATVVAVVLLGRRLAVEGKRPTWPTPATVAFAVAVWLVVAPAVLGLNAFVNWLDPDPDTHPLAKLGSHPALMWPFLLSACVATPFFEELLVRGIILPWACQHRTHAVALFLPAGLFALLGGSAHAIGVLAFFGFVVLGFWLLLTRSPGDARRTDQWAAVYGTSALFAAAHASVWPTPIPLFAFSLALGWLAVRTGGIAAPTIVHGLLNAVSAVYVLRGGPV